MTAKKWTKIKWREGTCKVLFCSLNLLLFCRSLIKKMDLTKLRRWRQRQRQQAIGLVSKTTTLHVHHAFSFISFRSLHNYDQILSFFWGRERQGDSFYHLCLNSACPPLFSSNLNSLLWKDAESIVQRRFYGRRRCRIVRSLIVYDSDNNENVITARGLLSKQQVCRCITLFFYISLPLLQEYDGKLPNFTCYGGRKQVTTKFSFSS